MLSFAHMGLCTQGASQTHCAHGSMNFFTSNLKVPFLFEISAKRTSLRKRNSGTPSASLSAICMLSLSPQLPKRSYHWATCCITLTNAQTMIEPHFLQLFILPILQYKYPFVVGSHITFSSLQLIIVVEMLELVLYLVSKP